MVLRHFLSQRTQNGSTDNMVEAVYQEFGQVDVLVNNAGMSPLYLPWIKF